jgi:2-polyprenyl-3-methyl-5-hydroxy-6-metoxy-1,4-benzoquinol methylase
MAQRSPASNGRSVNPAPYEDLLLKEAEAWNRAAEELAAVSPPDWRYRRDLPGLPEYSVRQIDALLEHVRPGMRALDLACGSGWLTLALAQRGAHAHGIDVADRAIEMAQTYFHSIETEVPGQVSYQVADLNHINLPSAVYDIVVANGALHHLIDPCGMIDRVHRALKPGGFFWVSDKDADEAASTVLLASVLMAVLPTRVSYVDKLRGLLRFGFGAPARIRASMQTDGYSPFEGAGRGKDWPGRVHQLFELEQATEHPAVTLYLAAEIRLPISVVRPLLRGMGTVDSALVRWKLLRSSGITLVARKRADVPAGP